MTRWCRRYSAPETCKQIGRQSANHGPIGDSRPIAFLGYPEGHRVGTETGCRSTGRPIFPLDTLFRTRASQEPTGHHGHETPWMDLGPAQTLKLCGFRCLTSKRSPLFQTLKVMAAILRAKVRRAISGFIPLPSKPA